ncbi:MAG: vitamin B12 dependent-methionine synthase activation domain-containing protein, partial [Candidatus Cloacimonetes bacterium]|nr:vitamin B12 dependent-methionine synthase activation domain-containing protein [Candidatus Cloacimonadota bacterium]
NQTLQTSVMIDSTSLKSIETALQHFAGKTIINSTNFESGDKAVIELMELAARYGACLVCLAIDEKGMAKTCDEKIAILKRLIILADEKKVPRQNLFFDCLTFSLGTGEAEYRNSAKESLKAIRYIKENYPQINLLMGVSNVSFGLKSNSRKVLNSLFLYECVRSGIDAAIVDAAKILPLNQITEKELQVGSDLILNNNEKYDPLMTFIELFEEKEDDLTETQLLSNEEIIRKKIINGNGIDIDKILNSLLGKYSPMEIINNILLESMKQVGDLFSKGFIQLPFVLKSAEIMKKSVTYLEKYISVQDTGNKGKIVLATVQGDVHDIGKNLVEIILTNNGYNVVDLGIKQTPLQIAKAIELHRPDALGLSALLIKSTLFIKETLQVLAEKGIRIPVICGGAALTSKFVENELTSVYQGEVYYGRDAFDGLRCMETIMTSDSKTKKNKQVTLQRETNSDTIQKPQNIPLDNQIPIPPFYGNSDIIKFQSKQLFDWINLKSLFYQQWQFTPDNLAKDTEKRELVESTLKRMKETAIAIINPKAVYGFYTCKSKDTVLNVYLKKDVTNICNCKSCLGDQFYSFELKRNSNYPFLSVADFFRKEEHPRSDLVGFQAVTLGLEAVEFAQKLKHDNQFQEYFFWHGFCSVMTEALAALIHKEIRNLWKIDLNEQRESYDQKYQGCRYSFGYNCCPDLSQQNKILELLSADRIDISMNEADILIPEFSTVALIAHHPLARYW